ncbi:DUF4317 family protein [Butyrivibrio fibrisolvens]|uniref:DUF4317 family protein n=1 Tax=Butyrivibrio fibrisolvens TaxID=831 RepID=UPI0003B3646D|nr:DUF4317 family protein [Butyrivibrio fibrisolvens]
MNRSELLEIKKRFKFKDCSFSGMAYAVFDNEGKEIEGADSTRFLTLDDDEQKKYISLISKAYSSAGGAFAEDVTVIGDDARLLTALAQSDIPDAGLVRAWAQQIIDNYDADGEFALLVFSDAYDVPAKDTGKNKTGESEEVYNYIAACICPFKPAKGGIMKTADNKLHASDVIKVLGNPVAGFMYPSFNDRSSDYDNMLCVVKNDPERNMIRGIYAADVPDYVKPQPKKKDKGNTEDDGLTTLAGEQSEDAFATADGYGLYQEQGISQSEGVDTSIRQNSDVEIQTRPEGFGENIETLTEKAMQEKLREEAMMEEESEQVFEGLNNFHKDQVVLPEDKIIERDVNGRKFFLVPESLIPYDKLKALLDSLMNEA